ncbi:MAG TPA: C_GCAxxG_C_C family protein [Dehalococcoidia bacterium]|nr:C_GCAxxG_C_C family protein [Dehalococcoidia bacterium]
MAGKPSPDYAALKARVQELTQRVWDLPAIKARYSRLAQEGIPRKTLHRDEIIAHKQEILERVQKRAEEYEFLSHSCAKGSALALMEEFGLGNMEIAKALSPFPGFGMTGWICGAVTGGLIALGLYFGSDDILDYEGTGRTMTAARTFIPRFEEAMGSILCPKIQEEVIFGRYMDPRASRENFDAFVRAGGYEKCALPPGVAARLAAQVIIESLESVNCEQPKATTRGSRPKPGCR